MKKTFFLILGASLLVACDPTQSVDDPQEVNVETDAGQAETDTQGEEKVDLDGIYEVEDQKTLSSGIAMKWFEHGSGDLLKQGDLVRIDYKVYLKDGNVVDGNHLLKMESLPFMVGFGMQTEGWDIALKEMRVGDFAEVIIPSKLARGEKGIEGLIPPNADNILKIRILERVNPDREVDGNKIWMFEENEQNTVLFGDKNEIEFHTMVSTPTNPLYVNTFSTNTPFKLRLDDGGTVPGLKKALINAKKSDRMFVLVPSSEAYGSKGYLDLVKPNEDLLYNILVMDVSSK